MSPALVAQALPEEVASVLARELASGPLGPGDRLPTEQMLVARFGVSRAVVREAISRLKSDGLVVSRRGSGLYVAPPARRSFRLDAGVPDADLADVGAVFELREAVEEAASGLAALRRTTASLAAIERAHEVLAAVEDWDGAGGVAADIEFHRAVAAATGNARFTGFITFLGNSLAEAIRVARAAASVPDGTRRVTIGEHARILAAIQAGNAAAARRAARAHLRGARRRMGL